EIGRRGGLEGWPPVSYRRPGKRDNWSRFSLPCVPSSPRHRSTATDCQSSEYLARQSLDPATTTPNPGAAKRVQAGTYRLGRLKSRPCLALCKLRRPDVYARPLSWILTVTLASVAAVPACADGLNFTNAYDGNKRVESCSDMKMNFWKTELGRDGIVTVRRSQTISLASQGSKPLKVEASDRGYIHVQPSTDGIFSALVCMAAGAASNGDAEAILRGLSVENSDGHLTVEGPDDG